MIEWKVTSNRSVYTVFWNIKLKARNVDAMDLMFDVLIMKVGNGRILKCSYSKVNSSHATVEEPQKRWNINWPRWSRKQVKISIYPWTTDLIPDCGFWCIAAFGGQKHSLQIGPEVHAGCSKTIVIYRAV